MLLSEQHKYRSYAIASSSPRHFARVVMVLSGSILQGLQRGFKCLEKAVSRTCMYT